jgi:hypothetical protein
MFESQWAVRRIGHRPQIPSVIKLLSALAVILILSVSSPLAGAELAGSMRTISASAVGLESIATPTNDGSGSRSPSTNLDDMTDSSANEEFSSEPTQSTPWKPWFPTWVWNVSATLFGLTVIVLGGYSALMLLRGIRRITKRRRRLLLRQPRHVVDMRPLWYVAEKLSVNQIDKASEAILRVREGSLEFATATDITFVIKDVGSQIAHRLQERVDILDLWVDFLIQPNGKYEPEDREFKRAPVTIMNLVGPEGARIESRTEKGSTRISIVQAVQPSWGQDLEISFTANNIYRSGGDRYPFDRQVLNVNVAVLMNDSPLLLHIETPQDISLRGRNDGKQNTGDAYYYSVALSVSPNYLRNTAFFAEPFASLRYYYGRTDASALATPGIHLFNAGLALLTGGFALDLLFSDLQFLGAVTFGLSVATSFIEAARTRRLFFPSSTLGAISWLTICATLCGAFHLASLIAIAWTLGWQESWRYVVAFISMGVGFILLTFALWYFAFLQTGTFHGYTCDRCQRWILNRRRASRDFRFDFRLALCGACAKAFEDEFPILDTVGGQMEPFAARTSAPDWVKNQ